MQKKLPSMQVSSAGLAPMLDQGIEESAASVLKQNGYEVDQHKPRKVNRQLISDSDLVLVMEYEHQNVLMRRYPGASGKIMLLGKWCDDMEIFDPYLKSPEVFVEVFEQIEKSCEMWSKRLAG